jgi:hypothetical protein
MSSIVGRGPVGLLVMCPNPALWPGPLPIFFFGEGGRTLIVELNEVLPRSPLHPYEPSLSDRHVTTKFVEEGRRLL